MSKTRLEAFTDAVIAIVMTLLVLELHTPKSPTFSSLWQLRYSILIYLISFLSLAVYWNNHHHLLQAVRTVNGAALWANILLILFLSFLPFATSWVDENIMQIAPEVFYGIIVLLTNLSFGTLTYVLVRHNGPESAIAKAIGKNTKQKITLAVNAIAILLAFVFPPSVIILFALSMLLWVIPDKRIEKLF